MVVEDHLRSDVADVLRHRRVGPEGNGRKFKRRGELAGPSYPNVSLGHICSQTYLP